MSEPGGAGDAFTFSAFISYARHDRADAVRLQRRLEQYRLDADLRVAEGERFFPARPLQPVFRDEDELVPGQDLPERIRKGLEASRFLIVLASRAAVQSQWVEKEILDFMALGKAHRIIVLVIDGEPNALRSGKAAELECLPRPFRLKHVDGQFTDAPAAEPNWVDWRGRRKHDRINFLRQVAALLQLDRFDDLVRRDARAERRRLRFFQAASAVFVAVGLAAIGGGFLAASQLDEVRKTESRFLARIADDLAEPGGDAQAGDHARALQIAIEGAPTATGALFARPFVVETEAALRRSVTHMRLRKFLPHETEVRVATFSPDGTRIVTLSSRAPFNPKTTVSVWDAASGQLAAKPVVIDSKYNASTFGVSFAADGRLFAAVAGDTVQLFDAATATAAGAPIDHDFTNVSSARLSPDGQRVLITMDGGDMFVANARTGARIVGSVHAANRDLTRVAQTSETALQLIDALTGKPIGSSIPYRPVMTAADFSPDGARLLMIGDDKASLYDTVSGAQTATWIVRGIAHAEFNAASTRVLTAANVDAGGEARWWDAATGAPVGEPMRQAEPIGQLILSPDGRYIATNAQGVVRIWNAATGAALRPISYGGDKLGRIVFSRDDALLATISSESLRLWETATGRARGEPIDLSIYDGEAVFSPDHDRLIVRKADEVRLIDTATGMTADALKHEGSVTGVMFGADAATLLTASEDASVRLWDVRLTRQPATTMNLNGDVRSAAVSPDGTLIAVGSEDGAAHLLAMSSGERIGAPMVHGAFVEAVTFNTDGTRLLSRAFDARLWSVPTGKAVGASLTDGREAKDAVFSPDGTRVAAASVDGSVHLWSAANGARVGAPLKHEASVNALRFGANGRLLLTVSGKEDEEGEPWLAPAEVRVWSVASSMQIARPYRHLGRPDSVALGPEGIRLVTSPEVGVAQMWDARAGVAVGPPLKHPAKVVGATFSPDGQRLLTQSFGDFDFSGLGHLWDVGTGQLIAVLDGGSITTAHFNGDGTRIATGSWGGAVQLWDGRTGAPIRTTVHRFGLPVGAGVFSSDGRFLITSGLGFTRVWDARTGAAVGTPLAGDVDERAHSWIAAHGRIVTTDGGIVRSWDVRDWTDDGPALVSRACAALNETGVGPLPQTLRERSFRSDGSRPCAAHGLLDWRYYAEALGLSPAP